MLGGLDYHSIAAAVKRALGSGFGFIAKGDLLVGTGLGNAAVKSVGPVGTVFSSDPASPDGTDWVNPSALPAGFNLGQCFFGYTSATVCTLSRRDGRYLFIDGKFEEIPSAGVTLSNSGLSASTLYYVYAWMNGGTMELEASATARATDATYGHEIKSGDATRTLVGLLWVNGSSQFANSRNFRYVRSWANNPGIAGGSVTKGSDTSIGSGPWIEVDAAYRARFVAWAGEVFSISGGITMYDPTGNPQMFASVGIDSASSAAYAQGMQKVYADTYASAPFVADMAVTEGFHDFRLLVGINGGNSPVVSDGYSGYSYTSRRMV